MSLEQGHLCLRLTSFTNAGLASNDALERTAYLLDKMSEFVDPRVFEKMNQNKLLQHIQK